MPPATRWGGWCWQDAQLGGWGWDVQEVGGTDLLLGDVAVEFQVDGLGVGPHDRHADAGGGDVDVLLPPDLVGLLHHLHLLLVVPVLRHG